MPVLAIVQVQDPRVRWGVHAGGVVRIIPATEWRTTPVLDVFASLGAVPRTGARARRVVVVRGAGGRETALLAAGPIDISDVDSASVLSLPAVLAGSVPQIAGIIVGNDASLSLLLELAAVITPEDIGVGEELCPSRS